MLSFFFSFFFLSILRDIDAIRVSVYFFSFVFLFLNIYMYMYIFRFASNIPMRVIGRKMYGGHVIYIIQIYGIM